MSRRCSRTIDENSACQSRYAHGEALEEIKIYETFNLLIIYINMNLEKYNDEKVREFLNGVADTFGDVALEKFLTWMENYRGNDLNDFTIKQISDEQWPLFLERVFESYEVPKRN